MKTIVARPFGVILESMPLGKKCRTLVLLNVFYGPKILRLRLGSLSQQDIQCLIMNGEQSFRIGKKIFLFGII